MSSPFFLFDVDGVVIRDNGYFSEAFCREYDVPVTIFDTFFQEDFPLCVLGRADAKACMQRRLSGTILDAKTESVFKYWFSYNGIIDESVLQFVDSLANSGFHTGLATVQESHRVRYLLEHLELQNHFYVAYPSCEIGFKKPDPQYFHAVAERIERDFWSHAIVFVDDKIENVESAREAGWHAHHFLRNESDAIERLEAFLRSFADMK